MQRYSAGRHGPAISILGAAGIPVPDVGGDSPPALNRLRGHDFGRISVGSPPLPRIQKKSVPGGESPGANDDQADLFAEQITGDDGRKLARRESASPASRVAYAQVQRAAMPGATPGPVPSPARPTPAAAEPPASAQTAARALIVDDDAEQVGSGQMRKGAFLDQLQSSVCSAADAELARVGRNTRGCPYIEGWIGHYRKTSAQHLERALRRYAPEAASARTAVEYIPAVTERVRRGVALWATTGQMSGIPEELMSQLPGAGLLGAVAGAMSGIIGSIGAALGGIFGKARDGGVRDFGDPQQIKGQLGTGQSLDGAARSRMEAAFGHSFAHVRVHTDGRAADLSSSLNARAFTIGSDVAFGAGEYKPGTLIGDALLAHELAHVVQQSSAGPDASAPQMQGGEYTALEEDADKSAVSAVASIWSGIGGIGRNAFDTGSPRLRSGLRLSRCKGVNEKANPCTSRATAATPVKTVTVRHSHLWDGKSAGDFATHLAYANRVYTIAGIAFAAGNVENIDEPNTKDPGLLGSNGLLNESDDDPRIATYTAEETALMSHNRAAGQMRVFYIKNVENDHDLNGMTYTEDNAMIVVNDAPSRTFPHEAGHLLIGGGHPSNNDNIMAQSSKATGVDCLSDDQIDAARGSSLAQ